MNKHEEKKSMTEDPEPTHRGPVKVGSNSAPKSVAVHMFELMRDGGLDEIELTSVGPMALQKAFHSVIALNDKLSSRGQAVVIHPTYVVEKVANGYDKTTYKFTLLKRSVKFDG